MFYAMSTVITCSTKDRPATYISEAALNCSGKLIKMFDVRIVAFRCLKYKPAYVHALTEYTVNRVEIKKILIAFYCKIRQNRCLSNLNILGLRT